MNLKQEQKPESNAKTGINPPSVKNTASPSVPKSLNHPAPEANPEVLTSQLGSDSAQSQGQMNARTIASTGESTKSIAIPESGNPLQTDQPQGPAPILHTLPQQNAGESITPKTGSAQANNQISLRDREHGSATWNNKAASNQNSITPAAPASESKTRNASQSILDEKALQKVRSLMGSDTEPVGNSALSVIDNSILLLKSFRYRHNGEMVETVWEIRFDEDSKNLLTARQKEIKGQSTKKYLDTTTQLQETKLKHEPEVGNGQSIAENLPANNNTAFRPHSLRIWTLPSGKRIIGAYSNSYLDNSGNRVVTIRFSDGGSAVYRPEQLSDEDQAFLLKAMKLR